MTPRRDGKAGTKGKGRKVVLIDRRNIHIAGVANKQFSKQERKKDQGRGTTVRTDVSACHNRSYEEPILHNQLKFTRVMKTEFPVEAHLIAQSSSFPREPRGLAFLSIASLARADQSISAEG